MQEEKCIKYIIVVQQHQPDQLRYYEKEREKFFISSILLIRNSAFLNEKVRISHFFMIALCYPLSVHTKTAVLETI